MTETNLNSSRKEAYPTWPVPVANWRPQISVEGSQLSMQIAYKAVSSDKLQPNPTVDSTDIGVTWGDAFGADFPDVAGLPAPQLYQTRDERDLPLPDGFFETWDDNVVPAVLAAARDGGLDARGLRRLETVLTIQRARLASTEFETTVEVRIETLGGCLPPVSEQSSFIGQLPPSFDELLENTFVVERDENGRILQGDAQKRLAYNQRLNIRQEWISTATFQRNVAGSIYNRGPAVQGVQVQFPYIATQSDASYLQPHSALVLPPPFRANRFGPASLKVTNETGQIAVMPGQSYAALSQSQQEDIPDLLVRNLPRCLQVFGSRYFGKDQMYDLQRSNPHIFGAKGTKSDRFFSVQPKPNNAMYATFQRSNIGNRLVRQRNGRDAEASVFEAI